MENIVYIVITSIASIISGILVRSDASALEADKSP